MERKITQVTVCNDEGLTDESRISVSLIDDGDGEYVRLLQPEGDGDLTVTVDQWPALREAIEQLLVDSE